MIVAGMLTQAAALALLVAGGGAFAPALGAAVLLGIGTALVYPTLIAAVSDTVQPIERAQVVGVYRFWRDFGFVVGALLAGFVADAAGSGPAIVIVAALTGASGMWVAATHFGPKPQPLRRTAAELLSEAQSGIAPRLDPTAAFQALRDGAVMIDLRSSDERRREGLIPGSVHIPRSVLEWRLDPDSGYSNPHVEPGQRVIVFCAHGFSSSFAAVTLRDLGWWTATDIVGGYEGWKTAGLPTREVGVDDEAANGELPEWVLRLSRRGAGAGDYRGHANERWCVMAESDKVVVNLATGLEDSERVTVAFLVAGAALEKGKQVAMFLTKEAVRLGLPGYAESVACDGCPPVSKLFAQYAEGGGELLVCPICFNARKLDESALVANARLAGATPLWDWIDDGATVFSY